MAVPTNRPIAAVSAIASAPQNVTRSTDFRTGAPPALAAIAPSTARDTSEVNATVVTTRLGAIKTMAMGIAAPRVNAAADVKSSLDWPRFCGRKYPQFVTGVRAERIMRHELIRDFLSGRPIDTPCNIYLGQFFALGLDTCAEFNTLSSDVRLFGIRLRADRDIFASRHRHRASNKPGDARDQDLIVIPGRGRDSNDQACSRDDAVIGAQDCSAKPANARDKMPLGMTHSRRHGASALGIG